MLSTRAQYVIAHIIVHDLIQLTQSRFSRPPTLDER